MVNMVNQSSTTQELSPEQSLNLFWLTTEMNEFRVSSWRVKGTYVAQLLVENYDEENQVFWLLKFVLKFTLTGNNIS